MMRLAWLLLCASALLAQQGNALARDNTDPLDRLISALPDDTETIVVAEQPFSLSPPKQTRVPDALTVSRSYILNLLAAVDNGKLFPAFSERRLRFGVLVGRNFANHPPDASKALPLGLIAYQGCSVYAFANPIPPSAISLPAVVQGARQVWHAEGKQYTQPVDAKSQNEEYWLTLLAPDVLLACNDGNFFSSVLANWDTSARTSFRQLPEWKRVNRSAPVWGFRHFRAQPAATDPTDPRKEGLLGAKLEGAVGVIFEVGSPSGTVHALWESTSDTNPWTELSNSPDMHGAATVRAAGDGAWELSLTDNQSGAGALSVFAIMAFLGFAVLL